MGVQEWKGGMVSASWSPQGVREAGYESSEHVKTHSVRGHEKLCPKEHFKLESLDHFFFFALSLERTQKYLQSATVLTRSEHSA